MYQKEYNRMNEKMIPDPGLKDKVMEKAAPRRGKTLRPVAVTAVLLAIVILAMPVMAAHVPAVGELMYQVAPEMAVRFRPILESCVEDGIRMEVVAASVHGATAEVYISFEDLEGDRIDEDLRTDELKLLGKNVFLSGTWGSSIGWFNYDAESGVAVMVIEENYSFYSRLKGRYLTVDELFGGKITVSVDRLYRLVQDSNGEWVEETLAEGPWRVSIPVSGSNVYYVGPRDDGVPQTTGEE